MSGRQNLNVELDILLANVGLLGRLLIMNDIPGASIDN